ncbi:hypothetical protein L1D54_07555 [Vibrio brasiliensis]|uniref:hypothetical protein n=1 Tax=Vibrio brasiliensis TaxID=170652 RepID=UPI001EFDA098|nr:hypothetical protein [Vibrio brasiliensis]MCG9750331.1 hypothetical protein [Vibrio brasiliensis]
MKSLLFTLVALFFPASSAKNSLLNKLGANVSSSAKIRNCLFYKTDLIVGERGEIGYFNMFLSVNKVIMEPDSKIGSFNQFSGDFDLKLYKSSRISNSNIFRGAKQGLFNEESYFVLKSNSIVTSSHYFDLSSSIYVASKSVIGGRNSQFWTHGFLHVNEGNTRYIKLESIWIEDGVYIGSNCTINPGSIIEKNVNVVSATTVNGRLIEGGVYGSSAIRKIMQVDEEIINDTYEVDEQHSSGHPRIIKRKVAK